MERGFKVVIPARHASTRLPGKPLLPIAGRPMLEHVYRRARDSGAKEVIIATDDPRVRDAAAAFGAAVHLTSAAHRSGTERIAELMDRLGEPEDTVIVNVQGDEPLLAPALVRQCAENLQAQAADMASLCTRIRDAAELFDPAVVKVVTDACGFALYFSRAPIPWHREAFAPRPDRLPEKPAYFRHVGIYAYRAGFLRRYVRWPPCPAEEAESLEQLRALHHGGRIHVAEASEAPGAGVDTPEDLERVRRLIQGP